MSEAQAIADDAAKLEGLMGGDTPPSNDPEPTGNEGNNDNNDNTNEEGNKKPNASDKPPGYDPVDLDGLPDEIKGQIQERMNYLYKQAKSGQENTNELQRHNQDLANALDNAVQRLGDLEKNVGTINERTVKEEYDREMDVLRGKLKDARDTGDDEQADKIQLLINEKLVEAQVATKLKEKEVSEETKQDVASSPALSQEDSNYIEGLRRGVDGIDRPYMGRDKELTAKAQTYGAKTADAYFMKYGSEMPIRMLFPLIDKYMQGDGQANSAPSVLSSEGSNLTQNRQGAKLSEEQKRTMSRLGVSEDEASKRAANIATASRVSIEDFRKNKGKRS